MRTELGSLEQLETAQCNAAIVGRQVRAERNETLSRLRTLTLVLECEQMKGSLRWKSTTLLREYEILCTVTDSTIRRGAEVSFPFQRHGSHDASSALIRRDTVGCIGLRC